MTLPALAANVPLAPRTTLGVGGPARWLVEAGRDDLAEALAWARAEGLPVLVLGGGSNVLVADRGFQGLVLRPRLHGIACQEHGDRVLVEAGAGVVWDDLVARAVASGWAGLECLSGIPGEVGATPIQNVGAYGQDVAETVVRVRALDRASGEVVELDGAACAFGYRDSVFKGAARDRYVVLAVRFALRPGGAPCLRYAEVAARFAGRSGGEGPSLAEVREAVLALRRSKSMVLDPTDENGHSAGSFFTNPTLDAEALEAVRVRAGVAMPEHPAAGGRTKLSAAWLIEHAGFRKGAGEGRVGLSTRHTLAVVNRGGATAAEVVAFARQVRDGVMARFGVALVPEPVLVGFLPEETAGLVG